MESLVEASRRAGSTNSVMMLAVTGATGFLGQHVVRLAQARGFRVRALVRPGRHIPETWSAAPAVEVVTACGDHRDAVKLLAGADILIHLAGGGVHVDDRALDDLVRINVSGSLFWLDGARRHGVSRIVAIGSSAEYQGYGWLPDHPWPTAQVAPPISESHTLAPTDFYAASKAAGGTMLCAVAREYAMDLWYLRLCRLYGPGDHAYRLLPSALNALLANRPFASTLGHQVREWLAVEDAARAILAACAAPAKERPTILNVGTGVGIQQAALLRTLAEFAERDVALLRFGTLPHRPHEWHHLVMDATLTKNVLGWQPTVPLETGLKEYVQQVMASQGRDSSLAG